MAVTFQPVPQTYLTMMESIKFNGGVPISWLAAVCNATGFNPGFTVRNPATLTERQFGLAGIWADLPEVLFTPIPGKTCCNANCPANPSDGGWFVPGNSGTMCTEAPGFSFSDQPYQSISWFATLGAQAALDLANAILLDCASIVTGICGTLNATLFYRYVLGGFYVPSVTPGGACILPAPLPQPLNDAAWALVQAQAYYAPIYDEVPIVVAPGVAPPCPNGYTFNPTNGLCCTPQAACVPPAACPPGTTYDPVNNVCVQAAPTCTPASCPAPSVCVNDVCTPPCTATSCPPPNQCVNGVCATPCVNGTCAPPDVCVNGFCVPAPGAGGSLWPYVIAIGGPVLWGLGARLHELGKI